MYHRWRARRADGFWSGQGTDTTLAASQQGCLLGTLRYAAPEQLAYPRVEISPAVDVYGLGVTMWELLTRHRLFKDAEDERQLAMLMHESDVPPVRTVDPSVDRDLEAIVARATEWRMSERIETAGQLAAYLQLYLDGQPLPFLFDARGLLIKEIVLGADGQPTVTKEGRATVTTAYDTLGNLTQLAYFGRDGQALLDAAGIAGMKCVYDQYGNLQEVAFVGTDGQLVTHRHLGAAGRSFRYDARGNVVENTFFDLHRQLVTGKIGETVPAFARQSIAWDGQGRSLEPTFRTACVNFMKI